jgi:hypothetical protein
MTNWSMDYLIKFLKKFQERYRNNRPLFFREVLNMEPYAHQLEVLEYLDEQCKDIDFTQKVPEAKLVRVAIKSCKNGHKTALCAGIASHTLLCYTNCKGVATAPSDNQMKDCLWPEIHLWFMNALKNFPELGSLFEYQKEMFKMIHSEAWRITKRTSTKKESMQGKHANVVLVLVDEAIGLEEKIYSALMGTTGSFLTIRILISNPAEINNSFRKIFDDNGLDDAVDLMIKEKFGINLIPWKRWTFNAELIPEVPRTFIAETIKTYGIDSDDYKMDVLGEFPEHSGEQFIPRIDVEDCINREDYVVTKPKEKALGIDVGSSTTGGGDPSFITLRIDHRIAWSKKRFKRTHLMVDEIVQIVKENNVVAIFIDNNGKGHGLWEMLDYRLKHICFVIGVMAGSGPKNKIKYYNKRAELWGNAQHSLANKLWDIRVNNIEERQEVIDEFCLPRSVPNKNNLILIEDKKAIKNRNRGKATDRADSIIMAFAEDDLSSYIIDNSINKVRRFPKQTRRVLDQTAGH